MGGVPVRVSRLRARGRLNADRRPDARTAHTRAVGDIHAMAHIGQPTDADPLAGGHTVADTRSNECVRIRQAQRGRVLPGLPMF